MGETAIPFLPVFSKAMGVGGQKGKRTFGIPLSLRQMQRAFPLHSACYSGPEQSEFNFSTPAPDGIATWRESRKSALLALGKSLGLPLLRSCEIWLKGGVRLRGVLRLNEEKLLLETENQRDAGFEIDGVPFRLSEMESCLRLD
jgi:hypothetical protein